MCETARIMPRTARLSVNVTETPSFPRPRALIVRFWGSGRLMPLRIKVTRSFLATVLPPHLFERFVAQLGRRVGAAQLLKRIDGGVNDVVGVRGADALGEDVLDTRHLEHRAHRAAGDDAGPRAGRTQDHRARAEVSLHLVRNRAARERDAEQVLLRLLRSLADRLGDLVGLAQAGAHVATLVAHHHERGEREPSAAFDDLGDAVDEHHAVDELADVFIIDCHLVDLFLRSQNLRPASRAPSASAETRPWYL